MVLSAEVDPGFDAVPLLDVDGVASIGRPDFSETPLASFAGFEAVSASFDLRCGLTILPSACCWASAGDEACALRRCLFDGIPRAEARLLAIEEPTSRCGLWAAAKLCVSGRKGDLACVGDALGAGETGEGVFSESVSVLTDAGTEVLDLRSFDSFA